MDIEELGICVKLFFYNMVIKEKDLGDIKLVKSSRARRIIVRYKEGGFYLTYPPFVDISTIEKTIREMKPRLLKLRDKSPDKFVFTPDTEFRTYSFDVKIIEDNYSNYYVRLKDGVLTILCPRNTDYKSEKVQRIIKDNIEKSLRYEAKRLFPQKVSELSAQHGFTFTGIKINKSRTRWGSCSSKKSINLSYYCLLLPAHLIELIILHELCHTIEMNHSERFWHLLDKVTNNKAKELTRELKAFKTAL